MLRLLMTVLTATPIASARSWLDRLRASRRHSCFSRAVSGMSSIRGRMANARGNWVT